MKLDHPFLQLPVSFDAGLLAHEIEALGPGVWRPHPQGFAGNDALTLVSVDGDPDSDAVRGPMRPTPHLLACPYLMEVMHSLGAVWGRSRLMRLQGQAEVTPHVDINYYWREHMRIHVPIVTQPTVRFVCDGEEINMAEGECWTFDTWRLHRVHNDDHRERIHLVADTVGGPGFWELMREARPHDERREGWQPRHVGPSGRPVALQLESVNLPVVMSPWEVRGHIDFLVGEAAPSPLLDRFVREAMRPFLRDWQALWALHGDGGRGFDAYRARRERMRGDVAPFESIRLRNNVPLVKALHAIVTGNLVIQDAPMARPQPMAAAPAARPATSTPVRTLGGQFNPMFQRAGAAGAVMAPARAGVPAPAAPAPRPAAPAVAFDRPLVLLSAPRSGSTLLFETLAKAPALYTIGHESHRHIESLPGLHPSARGFDSNRLTAADATPAVVAGMHRNFAQSLRDRDGQPPAAGSAVRLLEKTPKNTLRVGFMRAVFPDARFVYLYREPRAVLASMIEAWQSGRFVTYPNLPGWTGLSWSLLLVPGWRELVGRPLEEIVARQWAITTAHVLDDLEALPASERCFVRYDDLIASPADSVRRVCDFAGLHWDQSLESLPLSRHTLTPPDPDKWRRHEAAIERVMPLVEAVDARARRFLGD